MNDHMIILCADQREIDTKRNQFKKAKKLTGEFIKCEGNTVFLKGVRTVTFTLGDTMDFDDEHLPAEAFYDLENPIRLSDVLGDAKLWNPMEDSL